MKIVKKTLTLLSFSTVLTVPIHGSDIKELDFQDIVHIDQYDQDNTAGGIAGSKDINNYKMDDLDKELAYEDYEEKEESVSYFELMDDDLEDLDDDNEGLDEDYEESYEFEYDENSPVEQRSFDDSNTLASTNYENGFEKEVLGKNSFDVSGEEFFMQLNDKLDALSKDYPIDCEEFYTFGSKRLKAVAKFFGTNMKGLSILNPGIKLRSLKIGTVICVVGKVKNTITLQNGNTISKLGKRPKKSMKKYKTKAGIDTCESLQEYSQPPLSLFQLIKLNAKLSCIDMLKTSQLIYLPKGTVITEIKNSASSIDRDCMFSSWSEWSICTDGKQTRMRNIYEEAKGNRIACPKAHETQKCKSLNDNSFSDNNIEEDENTSDDINALSQCSEAGQDGCSNPGYDYRVFTTACNYHDICWACDKPGKWGISKQTCDVHFHILMKNTCHLYWRDWFQKTWCLKLADIFYTGVRFVSDGYDADKCPSHQVALNAKLGGYHIGHKVPNHCPCFRKSCYYRGTPLPCWGRDTICGAGTTCNNCCRGYSWKWKFFFTACN